jgi:hypothetical protein
MKYLLTYLLSLSAFAQNIPQCPSGSYLIEYASPVNGLKKSLCGYQKDGNTIKHGEEFIFNANGEVIMKISYNHGKEGETPKGPTFNGHYLPGTEEASNKFIDSLAGKKILGPDEKLLSSIHDLMEILTLKKNYNQNNQFKVHGCDNGPLDWLKGALLNTPINKSYSFNDNCDASGSFEAKFNTEFSVSFKLRNLDDLNATTMKVIMSLNKQQAGIRYKFVVVEGSISSPSRQGKFNAEYQVNIDPMTGDALEGTQSGKITLTKFNDKEVNLSKKIEF